MCDERGDGSADGRGENTWGDYGDDSESLAGYASQQARFASDAKGGAIMPQNPEAVEQRKRAKMKQTIAGKFGKQNWNGVVLLDVSVLEHNMRILTDQQRWIVEELIEKKNEPQTRLREFLAERVEQTKWVTLLSEDELQAARAALVG